MTKKTIKLNNKTKMRSNQQAKPSRASSGLATRSQLDVAARQWAAVLKDPCNAALTYPCYPSSAGGAVLMRFESDGIYYATGTETAGILVWAPGVNKAFYNAVVATTDTTASTLANGDAIFTPGYTYLANNAQSSRAVAACMQVMYPGSELSRAGVVGVGIADAATFAPNAGTAAGGANVTTTPAAVRTMCQHVERMPSSVVEIKWYPGENDAANHSPSTLAVSAMSTAQGHNALFTSFSGVPAGTGIRIRLVLVLEVSLGSGQGQVITAIPPVSANTPNQVVRALFTQDPGWFIESATKAGKAVSNVISYVNAGRKAVQAFSSAAGLFI